MELATGLEHNYLGKMLFSNRMQYAVILTFGHIAMKRNCPLLRGLNILQNICRLLKHFSAFLLKLLATSNFSTHSCRYYCFREKVKPILFVLLPGNTLQLCFSHVKAQTFFKSTYSTMYIPLKSTLEQFSNRKCILYQSQHSATQFSFSKGRTLMLG